MRVLILPDAGMVIRERSLLSRLEIGLADEGLRVMQGIPRSLGGHEAAAALTRSVFARPVPFDDRGLPFTVALRARLLVSDIAAILHEEPGAEGVDAVFATGDESWEIARRAATRLGASLILEVYAQRQVRTAGALWRSESARAGTGRAHPPWFIAAGEAVATALRALVPSDRTLTAAWGVHAGAVARGAREPLGDAATAAVLASGAHPGAVRAALEALAGVARTVPGLRILIDAGVAHRLPVWRWTGGMPGMHERLSIIPELDGRHDVLTSADLLLIPEPLGEHRSVALQAMADGMLVVAAPDPSVDWFIPDQTALVLGPVVGAGGVSAETIRAALVGPRGLLVDPERAAALRASAAEHVRLHQPASGHVRAVLGACERAVAERDATPARRL